MVKFKLSHFRVFGGSGVNKVRFVEVDADSNYIYETSEKTAAFVVARYGAVIIEEPKVVEVVEAPKTDEVVEVEAVEEPKEVEAVEEPKAEEPKAEEPKKQNKAGGK